MENLLRSDPFESFFCFREEPQPSHLTDLPGLKEGSWRRRFRLGLRPSVPSEGPLYTGSF
jgi:hypothetical protein